jgi:hypothetical protein
MHFNANIFTFRKVISFELLKSLTPIRSASIGGLIVILMLIWDSKSGNVTNIELYHLEIICLNNYQ